MRGVQPFSSRKLMLAPLSRRVFAISGMPKRTAQIRGASVSSLRVHLSAFVQEQLHDFRMTVVSRRSSAGVPGMVLCVDVASLIEEQLDNLDMPSLTACVRAVQPSLSVALASASLAQKQPGGVRRFARGCHHQQRPAVLVLVFGSHLCPGAFLTVSVCPLETATIKALKAGIGLLLSASAPLAKSSAIVSVRPEAAAISRAFHPSGSFELASAPLSRAAERCR